MGGSVSMSLPVFLGVLVVSVVLHPVVLAEAAWEEDGWLRTSFAKERLDLGDEFGCYGMPGLSWSTIPERLPTLARPTSRNEPTPVVGGCSFVHVHAINAHHGGPHQSGQPRFCGPRRRNQPQESAGTPPAMSPLMSGIGTIWAGAEEASKRIASLEDLKTEVEMGGLVNLYWIGRVNDATVATTATSSPTSMTPGIWLTTWGKHGRHGRPSDATNTSAMSGS